MRKFALTASAVSAREGLSVPGEFCFSDEHDGIAPHRAPAKPFDPAVGIAGQFHPYRAP
jgi:hypothetical protein